MIQKLLLLFISFFSSLNQNKFSSTAKWFCLTFLMFQMGYGQTCNVVTNSTFTGNATDWTVGGSGVGWYYEPRWAEDQIYIEKDGAVNQSLRQPLSGLISNSLTLTFKIKGQNANRLSTCPTSAQLEVKLRGVTYMTINNPAGSVTTPNTRITTSDITTSNGATYSQSGFPLTVGGATSGITITQGTVTLTIPWNPATSTTADLEFVANTSNTAEGSCLAWGGDDWFLDDIMLYTNNPTAHNMSGTSVCAGTATTVGLLNSQLGVNYQLYRNGSIAVGSPVTGTGTAISFGSQTVTGVYTSVATAGTTGCTTPMNGSVSINPNPTLINAEQPAAQPAVCTGSAATINLTGLLPSTTSTINYTINGVAQAPVTGVTSNASGTASFTTPPLTIANNGQILQITGITNTSATPNCTSSFAANVTLAVNATPTLTGVSQPIAACIGSGATINLTGLLPNATSRINYSINNVAQTAVTGVVSDASGAASFSTVALTAANNGQQLRITGIATTSTTPSCSATFTQNVTLFVNPAPTLTGASQSTAVCAGNGALINLIGLPANSTSTISYRINSIAQTAITGVVANGSGAASFTSAALTATNNGQQLRITGVTVTSSTPNCSATFTQNVTLAVNPVLTAAVSISASSGTVCAGTNVTFTATPTNPGTTPVYQWKLNGLNVGTNSATYSNDTLLLNNDVVTCEMTSNANPCLTGSPVTSNAITVASAGPTTTGVSICSGGSGSLSSSYTCVSSSTQTASGSGGTSNSTSYGATGSISINFPALPAGSIVNNISTFITYRSNAPSWTNELRIQATPPVALGAVQSDLQAPSTSSSAGTIANAAFGTWGTSSPVGTWLFRFRETTDDNGVNPDANISNISIVVTYTLPGGTINWYTAAQNGTLLGSGASFNPVGVAGSGLSDTNTPGTTIFYAACSSNPGCRTPTAFVIRETPTTPVLGTITNINCTANTGSVVLRGLPAGNWTINQTGSAAASYTNTVANTTETTISGLASGSYTFTVTNASGCPSPASALVTISDFSSTTWNGSGWSTGAPNATTNVIVSSVTPSSPFTADLVACALTINSGVVATVPSGITLTITNAVTVNGSLTFENNSSLVQINDVSNTGAIVYKRISQPMVNFDYTYWSSPVVGQTLFNLSPNTLSDKYHSFTGTAWKVINRGAAVMQPGIGYIIRTPKAGTWPAPYAETVAFPYLQPVQFRGVPINGTFRSSETMVAGNFYLVGNPYPCALDADEFLFLNTHNRAILEGTIYLWTHNSAIKSSGSKYIYVSDDYASYNLTGGTATSEIAPSASNPGAVNTNAPSGYIAAGQSFFVTAEAPGNIEFTNLMRAGGANNGQFFKPGKTSKSKLEKHRLWLKMINSGGAYKQALIGYIEGATNSFDKSFDGLSFDGNSYIDFYSINESGNYVIQGRALPFNDTDIVPLGYRSTVAGDFTIAIDHADGNLATQRIFLEDKQTGTVSELTAGNYTFNTKAGTFNNRFVLKYTNRTLGTGDFETVDNSVSIVAQNKMITVNSTKDNLEKVFIYDVAGKQLYSKDNVNALQLIMQNLPFAQQVLLVKIVLENGMVTTKKVVFK